MLSLEKGLELAHLASTRPCPFDPDLMMDLVGKAL
jgi:hypothetical protein